MNYISITARDIANGPGVRTVLWLSGCEHHCKGCHNQETWDRTCGQPFTEKEMALLMHHLSNPYIQGVTISGGDPLAVYNRKGTLQVVRQVRDALPNKDIWIYSGYRFEELLKDETAVEAMRLSDVLVDGRFEIEKRSTVIPFRGSLNQRLIDLKASFTENRTVLFNV